MDPLQSLAAGPESSQSGPDLKLLYNCCQRCRIKLHNFICSLIDKSVTLPEFGVINVIVV